MSSSSNDKSSISQDRKPSLQELQTKKNKCQMMEWDNKHKAQLAKTTAIIEAEHNYCVSRKAK